MIALVILVFVDAHDAGTPLPGALARAAEEALGADARVAIRTLAADAPADVLVSARRAERALAAARIAWTDEQHSAARLEVVAGDAGQVRSSTLTFNASDPVEERGRAIGLVLAALLAPEKQARLERERAARAEAAAVVAAAPPPAPPPPAPRRFALDAAVEGGFAVDGAGSGAGGALGLRFHPARRIDLRFAIQARFGEISRAQSTTRDVAGGAGLVLYAIAPSEQRRLALALRAEALVIYQSLSHLSEDDPAPVQGARVLPGARALVEGQLALSPTLALMLAAGPEFAFGTTDVYVHQMKVAELAPVRLIVGAGLLARF